MELWGINLWYLRKLFLKFERTKIFLSNKTLGKQNKTKVYQKMGKRSVSAEQKWQIIGLLKGNNMSYRQIAEKIGVSVNCVSTTKKNYEATGTVADLPRAGRPNKLTERDVSSLFKQVRADPKVSNRKLAEDFNSKFPNIRVSKETVRKELKKKGIGSFLADRKPLLTVKHRLARRKWCKERLHWTADDWAKIAWSDESNYELINRKSRIVVKRFRSERYLPRFCQPRVQGGGGSIGIWGCMSSNGTGVAQVYKGRMNQFSYRDVLENALLPSAEILFEDTTPWKFQQDNATCHTARSIDEWFNQHPIEVLPWPAKSPDLNPIEHLWVWIDQQLARVNLASLEDLQNELHRIWLKIPNELCKKVVESMPKRVKACYLAKGGHFKY